jgi:hypothetical protein
MPAMAMTATMSTWRTRCGCLIQQPPLQPHNQRPVFAQKARNGGTLSALKQTGVLRRQYL